MEYLYLEVFISCLIAKIVATGRLFVGIIMK